MVERSYLTRYHGIRHTPIGLLARAQGQASVERRKSRDLLAAVCLVVRLREDALPSLEISDYRYLEMPVDPTAPRPEAVIADVKTWTEATIRTAAASATTHR